MADDLWADFAPQQAQSDPQSDPWADFSPQVPPDTSASVGGMAKQFGVGIGKGAVLTAGLGGDLRELTGAGADWIASKFPRQRTLSDLIAPGSSPAQSQTIGESIKRGLRNMSGLPGAFFNMPTSSTVQKGVEGFTGEFRKPQNFPEQVADTAGQFSLAMAGGPLSAGRNIVTRGLKTFGANVAVPALTSEAAGEIPGVKGTAAEPFVKAGTALATPAALSTIRAAFTPIVAPTNRQVAADYLKSEGINNLMAGQITGSEKQMYREATAGWKYDAARRKQLEELTAAANRRFGEDGPDAIVAVQRARPRIGQDIESAAKDLYVRMDPEFMKQLHGVEREAARVGLTPAETRRLKALRDNVLQAFDVKTPPKRNVNQEPYFEMTGEAFHNAIRNKSDLQLAIKEKGIVGHYASQLKEALMDVAARTGSDKRRTGVIDALERFRDARRQWANMLAVEKAISKSGAIAASGTLSPAGVFTAGANRERSDYARGRGDFAKLAQASNLLMTSLPQSGTAPRLMAQLPAKMAGAGLGSAVSGGLAMLGGAPFTGGLSAALAAPPLLFGWLAPKVQNSFVMSRPGQYLAGNRPAGAQPYPGLTREEQIRRALLLARPAAQASFGRP
jgi:hypothetical protein